MATEMDQDDSQHKRSADEHLDQESKRVKLDSSSALSESIRTSTLGQYMEAETYLIGPTQIPFAIHTSLLRKTCPELARQLSEGTVGGCDFISQDAQVFEMFVIWLYTGEVPPSYQACDTGAERLVTGLDKPDLTAHYDDADLTGLWVFAAHHGIYKLCNLTCSLLAQQNDKFSRTTTREAVAKAFQCDEDCKVLQRFLVQEAVYHLGTTKVPKNAASYASRYIAGILEGVMESQATGNAAEKLWVVNPCSYHMHSGDPHHLAENQVCRHVEQTGGPEQSMDRTMYGKFGSTATVLVGPTQLPFVIHADLACTQSHYFNGAINGSFAEGRSKCLKLEEENVVTFKLFMDWLYQHTISQFPIDVLLLEELDFQEAKQRKIDEAERNQEGDVGSKDSGVNAKDNHYLVGHSSASDASGSGSSDGDSSGDESASTTASDGVIPNRTPNHGDIVDPFAMAEKIHFQLIDLYIFADRRQVRSLRNMVITKLITLRLNGWPLLSYSYGNVHHAYEWLQPTSKLCEYIEDEATYCWDYWDEPAKQFMESLDKFPRTFLVEVIKSTFAYRLVKEGSFIPWVQTDICHYHEHEMDPDHECKDSHAQLHKRAAIPGGFDTPVASSDFAWEIRSDLHC